jgi:uncharacterized protein YodC (DUF2158 family)
MPPRMKKEKQFKSGDIVRLKSGGPDMTVVGRDKSTEVDAIIANTSDWVDCMWFAGKKCEKESFPPETLGRVEPSSSTRI